MQSCSQYFAGVYFTSLSRIIKIGLLMIFVLIFQVEVLFFHLKNCSFDLILLVSSGEKSSGY